MHFQSEKSNSTNPMIARSSSVSAADARDGLVKRMSTSITNLTGKLSRNKTFSGKMPSKTSKRPSFDREISQKSQESPKSQTEQDIDAMDDVLASIKFD